MRSSWMLIVTVVCGFVTGVVLFSCKHHGQGGQILTQSGCVCLAHKPAKSTQSLFIWVNFFFFGLVSERMKNPTREQAKGFSGENGRVLLCVSTFRHGRCLSSLCCCSALFLAVVAPNFLNRWLWQVLGQLCSAVADSGSPLPTHETFFFSPLFDPAF